VKAEIRGSHRTRVTRTGGEDTPTKSGNAGKKFEQHGRRKVTREPCGPCGEKGGEVVKALVTSFAGESPSLGHDENLDRVTPSQGRNDKKMGAGVPKGKFAAVLPKSGAY